MLRCAALVVVVVMAMSDDVVQRLKLSRRHIYAPAYSNLVCVVFGVVSRQYGVCCVHRCAVRTNELIPLPHDTTVMVLRCARWGAGRAPADSLCGGIWHP